MHMPSGIKKIVPLVMVSKVQVIMVIQMISPLIPLIPLKEIINKMHLVLCQEVPEKVMQQRKRPETKKSCSNEKVMQQRKITYLF